MLYRLLNVLPPSQQQSNVSAQRRPFVPKHSKVMALLSDDVADRCAFGTLQSLRDDDDGDDHVAEGVPRSTTSSSTQQKGLPLSSLLVTDSFDGRRLVTYNGNGNQQQPTTTTSAAIPSRERISAVHVDSTHQRLYTADTAGAVFVKQEKEGVSPSAANDDLHAAHRAARRDRPSDSEQTDDPLAGWHWNCVVSAAATAPSRGAFPPFGAAGGWVGLAMHRASSGQSMVCVREYCNDVRLVDLCTGLVPYAVPTQHMPTAVAASAQSNHCFYVAEGPLVSLYDVRVSAPLIAQSTWTTLRGVCVSDLCLLPSSTSTSFDTIALCSTDRSVCTMDTRKWAKLFSIQNVLKYDVLNICPVQQGAALVCSGRDSEVRLVSLRAEPQGSSSSSTHQNGAGGGGVAEGGAEGPETHSGSFRSRLQQTAQCASVWQGCGWVSNGVVAVGLSQGNELFAAC